MSRADAVVAKLNSVLKRFTPMKAVVYKRFVTRTGDLLTGHLASTSATDIKLNPQPYYSRLGRDRVPGGHDNAETVIDQSGNSLLADDYEALMSPSSITSAELANSTLSFVFKYGDGTEDVLLLLDYEAPVMAGKECAFTVYLRSVKRP